MMGFRKWLENNGTPVQWHSDIPTYHRGLSSTDQLRPGFVTVHDPNYYAEKGRRVFHDPEGKVGYSLLPHEDGSGRVEIAGLFNAGKRGWGIHAAKHAVKMGGNYLEAFEGDENFSLPLYYAKHLGAEPIGYIPWDDQYAPKGWDYETHDKPGIVQMKVPKEIPEGRTWTQQDFLNYQRKLHQLKLQAGVKMDENKKPKKNVHRDHICSFEEAERLIQNVDDIYFNCGKEIKEETDSKKS